MATTKPPTERTPGAPSPQPETPLATAQHGAASSSVPQWAPEEKALFQEWAKRLLAFPRSTLEQVPGQQKKSLRGAGSDQWLWELKITRAFGVDDMKLVRHAVNQLVGCLGQVEGDHELAVNLPVAMVAGIAPRDQTEGLLAMQMVATHNAAMRLLRQALLPNQTSEGINMGVHRATQLLRTFTAQVETLTKYRSGGKQTVTVKHVHVNAGGQEVVGTVEHHAAPRGGGGDDGTK